MALIIDPSVAVEASFNTEFMKVNPIVNVRQSGHRDLNLDEVRDI